MRILVVDDQAFNRDILSFILEDHHHEVIEAENGQQALERYREDESIDLILMDVNMPVKDGIQATREVKLNAEERFVPVIFVTALDDSDMLARCLEAGGDDFVPKPVEDNVLIAKISAQARSQTLYKNLKAANEKLEYHQRIMAREHTIVEQVFTQGMSRTRTRCQNVDSYTSPASMFNGDLVLVTPAPTGGVYVLVGDFTGHGLAAAIGSLPVSEIFYQLTEQQASVARIAEAINSRLHELLPSSMFFCATILYMEKDGKSLMFWSGGLNDMLVLEPGATELKNIASAYMPLGILAPEEFDDRPTSMEFKEGTGICIYTDGVNEAQNKHAEEFGYQRLYDILLSAREDPITEIKNAVHDFCEGTEQSDDISIVKLRMSTVVHCDKKTGEVVDVAQAWFGQKSYLWEFKLCLEDADLDSPDIVSQIISVVANIQGVKAHQDKIFTIVSELYSNALEHGILGLESSMKATPDGFDQFYRLRAERLQNLQDQRIELSFRYLPETKNSLEIIVSDTGRGFDQEKVMKSLEQNEEAFGRGLMLLKSMCDQLEYSQEGRCAKVVYSLTEH